MIFLYLFYVLLMEYALIFINNMNLASIFKGLTVCQGHKIDKFGKRKFKTGVKE